jgi:CheY-like chemotaxis protein
MVNCNIIDPMATSVNSLYKNLFIIDDDIEDQEIFMEALKEVDPTIQCYTALSGDDAFKQLEVDVVVLPDIIFLDLNMPKLNGKQVLRELRKIKSLWQIPVIMYSTSFSPIDIQEINHLGAVHHLLKPSRFDDLCKALSHVLTITWETPRPIGH